MSRVFAYCRVSTGDQHTRNQLAEIVAAGFAVEPRRMVEETISGSVAASERPGFTSLLNRLEPGDNLVVTKLDRLGRNAMDLRSTVAKLEHFGVRVHCLALGGIDLTSAAGKMTMTVIAAVAEFERDLIIERTTSGLNRARKAGKRFGRPPTLNKEQQAAAAELLSAGVTIADAARHFGATRQTIMRVRDAALKASPINYYEEEHERQ